MSIIEGGIELSDIKTEESRREDEEEDEEEETDFGGRHDDSSRLHHFNTTIEDDLGTRTPLLIDQLREEARKAVKNYYPKMSLSVEVKQLKKGLSARLYGETKWTIILTKKGELSKKINKDLKKALGLSNNEIIKENEGENSRDQERIELLEKQKLRTDISEEVRNTITNEINENEERIDERNQESEIIQNRMFSRERIKEIFKKHGFTVTAIVTSVGVVIGTIVSNLSSGAAKVTNFVGNGIKEIGKKMANGFKELGKKLTQILPGMIGAIASSIFRTAGDAIGFLAKNSWLLILAVVTLVIEQYTKKK